MTDSRYDGRRLRVLTIVDTMTRESPAIEVDVSLPSTRVVAVLERLAQRCGTPNIMYGHNGSKFVAKARDQWAHRHGVKLAFSRPGKPTDNPFIEAFNGRLRDECLDQHWCASLEDAQTTIEAWRVEYNTVRPHTALRTPLPLPHDRRCKHPPQRYRQRTPAMADGLTSRRWTVRELLALPLLLEPSGAI